MYNTSIQIRHTITSGLVVYLQTCVLIGTDAPHRTILQRRGLTQTPEIYCDELNSLARLDSAGINMVYSQQLLRR